MIKSFKDKNPTIENGAMIGEHTVIIGDVTLKKDSNIWFGTVIRGDESHVIVGEGTNIQENSVVHVDKNIPTIIGDKCTIGSGDIAVRGGNQHDFRAAFPRNRHCGEIFSVRGRGWIVVSCSIGQGPHSAGLQVVISYVGVILQCPSLILGCLAPPEFSVGIGEPARPSPERTELLHFSGGGVDSHKHWRICDSGAYGINAAFRIDIAIKFCVPISFIREPVRWDEWSTLLPLLLPDCPERIRNGPECLSELHS